MPEPRVGYRHLSGTETRAMRQGNRTPKGPKPEPRLCHHHPQGPDTRAYRQGNTTPQAPDTLAQALASSKNGSKWQKIELPEPSKPLFAPSNRVKLQKCLHFCIRLAKDNIKRQQQVFGNVHVAISGQRVDRRGLRGVVDEHAGS